MGMFATIRKASRGRAPRATNGHRPVWVVSPTDDDQERQVYCEGDVDGRAPLRWIMTRSGRMTLDQLQRRIQSDYVTLVTRYVDFATTFSWGSQCRRSDFPDVSRLMAAVVPSAVFDGSHACSNWSASQLLYSLHQTVERTMSRGGRMETSDATDELFRQAVKLSTGEAAPPQHNALWSVIMQHVGMTASITCHQPLSPYARLWLRIGNALCFVFFQYMAHRADAAVVDQWLEALCTLTNTRSRVALLLHAVSAGMSPSPGATPELVYQLLRRPKSLRSVAVLCNFDAGYVLSQPDSATDDATATLLGQTPPLLHRVLRRCRTLLSTRTVHWFMDQFSPDSPVFGQSFPLLVHELARAATDQSTTISADLPWVAIARLLSIPVSAVQSWILLNYVRSSPSAAMYSDTGIVEQQVLMRLRTLYICVRNSLAVEHHRNLRLLPRGMGVGEADSLCRSSTVQTLAPMIFAIIMTHLHDDLLCCVDRGDGGPILLHHQCILPHVCHTRRHSPQHCSLAADRARRRSSR
jgi:hypothetical protein